MVRQERDFSERHFTPSESVFDHAMLAPVFVMGVLVCNPRKVVEVLKREGIVGVSNGYKRFFDNMRPVLYYLPPK